MHYTKKTVTDIDVNGKKVFLRCDFNVPMDKYTGEITDIGRVKAALPTINYLLDNGAAVILCSHLGRPKGEWKPNLSLSPVATILSRELGRPVIMSKDVIGEDSKRIAAELKPGEVMLLENVRFHKEEEKNDPEFAKVLASMADIYVTDAFGCVHRAHASTAGISNYLPSVSGLLLNLEIKYLGDILDKPVHPLTTILGGSKVSDKLGVISNLLEKSDTMIIGGGMAFTFIKALGGKIGHSLCEDDQLEYAVSMIEKAKKLGVSLLLPVDAVAAAKFDPQAGASVVDCYNIPEDLMGLDIGPETTKAFCEAVRTSKTVVWNGPMGVFEYDAFANGTKAIANAIAETECTSIIGGGDSASAVRKFGLEDKFTHISTGGGASLEFLEGKILPGIACLDDKITKSSKRRMIIAGNWKMNKFPHEVVPYSKSLGSVLPKNAECDIVVCVPSILLPFAVSCLPSVHVNVGAQTVSQYKGGAYTGEISAEQLASLGIGYSIIGHSERRTNFFETDAMINKKAIAAINAGIKPILCVGEDLSVRNRGDAEDYVTNQLSVDLRDISAEMMKNVIIAYEPIWAIGTGVSAKVEDAENMCRAIRETLANLYGPAVADATSILYGGSMNDENAEALLKMENIDGGLIGGASLDPLKFGRIAGIAEKLLEA